MQETNTIGYYCTKKTRPWAQPRYGAVIERLDSALSLAVLLSGLQAIVPLLVIQRPLSKERSGCKF